MVERLRINWWVLVVRGLAAILFGVMAFIWEELTVEILVALFGAYALVDGIALLYIGVKDRTEITHWGILLLQGLLGVGAGLLTLVYPGITGVILLYLIAFRAILNGIFDIFLDFQLRKEVEGEFLLFLSGLVSVIFGVLVITRPSDGVLDLIHVIAFSAVSFGVTILVLSFKLREGLDSIQQQISDLQRQVAAIQDKSDNTD